MLCLCAVLGLMAWGCATQPNIDAAQRWTDPATESARFDELLALTHDPRPQGEAARALVRQIAFDRRYQADVRLRAMQWWRGHDAPRFRDTLDRELPRIRDVGAMIYACDVIVEEHWHALTPALLRSLSRRTRQIERQQRPEWQALAALHPQRSVIEVAAEHFLDAQGHHDPAVHVAAWMLASEGMSLRERLALIDAGGPGHALGRQLHGAWTRWSILPGNREELLRLRMLQHWPDASLRRRAADVVQRLDDAQREGLALRHLPVLVAAEDRLLTLEPAVLRERVRQRVAAGEHHDKLYDGKPIPEWVEAQRDWHRRLTWADVLAVALLLDAMADPVVVRAWFDQADRDLEDTTTEHGGLIYAHAHAVDAAGVRADATGEGDAGELRRLRYEARAYDPELRGGDYAYHPPTSLVLNLVGAIAQYHFHAQRYDNASFAGPGVGDLHQARHMAATNVVLTFIDADRLNVDFYQPDGIVVDLGTVHRPR